jgi:hypothetical protein
LPEKSRHSPLLIKGTSRREKVRKNLNPPPKKVQAGRELPITAPYLFKEHPEGKKGEKILVLVHFLKVAWRNVPTEGRREQEAKSGSSHRSES